MAVFRRPKLVELEERRKMKNLLKSVCVCVGLYLVINWIADNPQAINKARQSINKVVREGRQTASKALEP